MSTLSPVGAKSVLLTMLTAVWPLNVDGGLRVAVEEVVGDQLPALGLDADRLARDPVVLDGAAEIDGDAIGLKQVGVIQVAAAQDARAAHAQGVVVDVLVLHRGIIELHARAIVEDLVGLRRADEAEAA